MKVCPGCKKQWPDDYEGCPECGQDLTNVPIQSNINMGNANAVSGGVHSTDDHSVHDSNNQTNSNNASNSYNTTNNTTIYEANKTEEERLHDNLLAYRLECKKLCEDGVISSEGEATLRELQYQLKLGDELVIPIKEEVKQQSKKRRKQISNTGLTDIRQTKTIIEQNTAEALKRQLLKLESLMDNYDDDSLKQVYYQMSSMLEPVRYADRYEKSDKCEYWEAYWGYVAYLLQRREKEAYDALASLSRWHKCYPEQNDVILHITGRLIQNDSLDEIKKERNSLSANYTSDLQLLLDSIDELLNKDWEQESILLRPVHSFYIKTLFADFFESQKERGQKELKERKEREERERKEREERERKEREERERKEREEQERKEREERERKEREERERREREERERRERIIAWWERNIWIVIGSVIIISLAIFLWLWIPKYNKAKEEEQKRIELYQTQQSSYENLSKEFLAKINSVTYDNALFTIDAYNLLCEMHELEESNPAVRAENKITYLVGRSMLLAKSDSILEVIKNASQDSYCSKEEKIMNQDKIDRITNICNRLR